MTRIISILVVALLVGNTQAFFNDQAHKEKAQLFLNDFVTEFTSKYNAISLGAMDFMGKMELAFDYWITKIKIHNFETIKFEFDTENDILSIIAPEFNVDLIIEDKYTIPIKIHDFSLSIIFVTSPTVMRCTQVEIDYGTVSLDVNMVVEYLSRQLLSLDMVKSALKGAEMPLRNLFANGVRNNNRRLQALIGQIDAGTFNVKELVEMLASVKNTKSEDGEYILLVKDLFSLPSQRYKEQKDDL